MNAATAQPWYESRASYDALPEVIVPFEAVSSIPYVNPLEPGRSDMRYRTGCAWGDVLVDGEAVRRVVYA